MDSMSIGIDLIRNEYPPSPPLHNDFVDLLGDLLLFR